MANVRMRIAAGVTVLGLGGLAGYALGSNDGPQSSIASPTTERTKPKIETEVIHRTRTVRANGGSGGSYPGGSGGSYSDASYSDASGSAYSDDGGAGDDGAEDASEGDDD